MPCLGLPWALKPLVLVIKNYPTVLIPELELNRVLSKVNSKCHPSDKSTYVVLIALYVKIIL